MAIDELRRRFGSALRLNDIYRRHPHLEKEARRLMLTRSRDVDHLSPRNFVGDITAGSCDIRACYFEGRAQAVAFLKLFGEEIDFDEIFAQPETDLMRPMGGKYPGVSKEVDRSLADAIPAHDSTADTDDDPQSISRALEEIIAFDGPAAVAAEQAAESQIEPHSVWIHLDDTDEGKKVHKKSIIRTLTDATLDVDTGKSHDRLLRIRCFSLGGDHGDRKAAKIHNKSADEHLLRLEGLFATLVAANTSQVSLAILQCTVIKSNATNQPQYLDAAPITELGLPDTHYTVTGQILSLVPFFNASDTILWTWDTGFVAFESARAKHADSSVPTRMRHLSICANGYLVLPLSAPALKPARAVLEDIAPDVLLDVAEAVDTTWVFSDAQLESFKSTLLARVQAEEAHLRIPVYGPVRDGRYPYEADLESSEGNVVHVSHHLNSAAAPSSKDGCRKCLVCGKDVAGPDCQNHMGKHILLSMRGISEKRVVTAVSPSYPCGFCGKTTSTGACVTSIRGGKANSTCTKVYGFQIAAASKSSATKPCTNVPVKCALCSHIHWKYNMETHLREVHPDWQLTTNLETRELLESKTTITHSEECRMGIPEASMITAASQTAGGPSPGEKRPALSPAGTPHRPRVRRITHTQLETDVIDDSDSDFVP